jgi:SAM-dependent methyltransferase
MTEHFSNVYEDRARADAYAALEFPGTYYLAYRDLPAIIGQHVRGKQALDFGCGAGRSTRFLKKLGFDVVGVDISEAMLARARERDPDGEYRLLPDGDLGAILPARFDLILSVFPFDNIPTMEKKVAVLSGMRRLLGERGRIVNLVTAPHTYWHEWASFSTKDFPANRTARSGDKVLVVMLDVEDRRPVEDILCTDEDYRGAAERAGLTTIETYRPLGKPSDGIQWVSETTIAPWVIHVLGDRALAPPKHGAGHETHR